jgi:hypothetical protein
LEPFTTYFTRVRSSLLPYYGETTSFTTQGEVSYFISPEDGATSVGDDQFGYVLLDVTVKALAGAEYYTGQLSEDPDFAGGAQYQSTNLDGLNTLQFWPLPRGTTFYARVKTNLFPDWGPVTSFQTTSGPGDMQASAEESQVFPNPSVSAFTFKRGTEEIESISITDANGMVVYQSDRVENGESFQFGGELKKGIYILKVRGTAGEKVIRLIKQ